MKIISIKEIPKRGKNERIWRWKEFTSELKKRFEKKGSDIAVGFSISELRQKLNVDENRLNNKRFIENIRTRARRTTINNKQLKVSTKTENKKTTIFFYLE